MSVFVQNSNITFEPIINKTCEAPQNDKINTHLVKKWPEKANFVHYDIKN